MKNTQILLEDDCGSSSDEAPTKIATIAVIDLETNNLPSYNCNKPKITELCVYGFAASVLKHREESSLTTANTASPQPTPRVIHKLNMLFNPRGLIDPVAEEKTGLSNYILEHETALNENAANAIINFIQHLQQPVCLVAHNGWHFDFPIIKYSLDKLSLKLPAATLCVDSLRAFLEIDEKRNLDTIQETKVDLITTTEVAPVSPTSSPVRSTSLKQIDMRALNETTPKRPILSREIATLKRKKLVDRRNSNNLDSSTDDDDDDDSVAPAVKRLNIIKSRRALFKGMSCSSNKKFPPKGVYQLGAMYTRIFSKPAMNAHQAEADVCMVTELIQHYGIDFLGFAESQAIPFTEIRAIGARR